MAHSYPKPGYRPGSPRRSPGGSGSQRRPLPRPAPYTPRLPSPVPGMGNAWRWGGLAARQLPKLIPGLAAGFAAYELYRWYKSLVPSLAGYSVCYSDDSNKCSAPEYDGVFKYTNRASCAAVSLCFVGNNTNPFFAGRQQFIAQARATSVFGNPPNTNTFNSIIRIWQRVQGLQTDPGVVKEGAAVPQEVPIPDRAPNRDPSPLEHPVMNPLTPWFDPMAIPLQEPQPTPVAPPYPAIPNRPVDRPDRDPVEQPSRGPLPVPRTRPYPATGPSPTPQVELYPRVERRLAPHYARAPGPGVKEKKLIGSPHPAGIIAWGINLTTETADWVECIHSGLPKSMQAPRKSTPDKQAAAIYRGVNSLDWGQVLYACAMNQIIDYVGGKIGQATARANRRLGLTGGTIGRTMGNVKRYGGSGLIR